jgi:hypothetical protein
VRARRRCETLVAAFTPEQIDVLRAAFGHVWSRLIRVQDDVNDESTRLVALLEMLVDRAMLTPEQFEAAVDELAATAGIESGLARLASQRATDDDITAQILNGDLDAFKRRLAEEEEER